MMRSNFTISPGARSAINFNNINQSIREFADKKNQIDTEKYDIE